VEVVVALGIAVALGAAVRSTWSPCGQSMLSQITPFTERARNHHFGVTAGWFVAGSVAGGATLGVLAAAEAWGLLAGEGNAISRMEDYELHRTRHLSRRERRDLVARERSAGTAD